MNDYIIPNNNYEIEPIEIEIKNDLNNDTSYISKTLHKYVNYNKELINKNFENWDFLKKYTNPYEFIHTIIPNHKASISSLKPLSRSFYKMVEICNTYNLLNIKDKNINSFHLAEGPGGFIEAIAHLRQNISDTYIGMTLIDENPNVPSWKKSMKFIEKNINVTIEKGKTGDGNLLNKENLLYCKHKYGNSMNIITGDGGFDFSINFNQQEILASKLLFAEIIYALVMQKHDGHFVLKVYDIYAKISVDFIYLLNIFYKEVHIFKPYTSRIANSEKYIICKNFKKPKNYDFIINKLIDEFDKLSDIEYISSLLNIDFNYYFINRIEEINAIYGQKQIENINYTINMIEYKNKNEKIENNKKKNITKCIDWCIKNNIPYNKINTSSNIFISS